MATSRVRQVGRLRLRKRIVTEDAMVTVTVRKEVLELQEEAITEGDVVDPVLGSDQDGDVYEMILSEEQFVVEKRIVPKERVRLVKSVVSEDETVTGDVRREQVEVEGYVIRSDS